MSTIIKGVTPTEEKTLPTGIALGSNQGDREKNIREALKTLVSWHEGTPEKILLSSLYETTPDDCPPNSNNFLNAVIQIDSSIFYTQIVKNIFGLEASFGRPSKRDYHAPRTLDLDLLYQGEHTTTSDNKRETHTPLHQPSSPLFHPSIELPHPRIRQRIFVLQPLAEILPNIQLPGWEKRACDYLTDLSPPQMMASHNNTTTTATTKIASPLITHYTSLKVEEFLNATSSKSLKSS